MLECILLGDSIAVGTNVHYHKCELHAKVGINSADFNKQYPMHFLAPKVIISLGSNDYIGIKTYQELQQLRNRIDPRSKVYWIVPANKSYIQEIVKVLAEQNKDVIINIKETQPDKVHPSINGYKDIVKQIKDGNKENTN
jgi:hypothetical protein